MISTFDFLVIRYALHTSKSILPQTIVDDHQNDSWTLHFGIQLNVLYIKKITHVTEKQTRIWKTTNSIEI